MRTQDAAYIVDRHDPRLEVWSRMIKQSITSGKPLYIEFDPDTERINRILQPSFRQVEFVASTPEGSRLKLTFNMAPSAYFLDTTRSEYPGWRALLEEHKRTKAPLLVTEDPETQEVLDARVSFPEETKAADK